MCGTLKVIDDNGDELEIILTRHSKDQFRLRYSLLYKNVMSKENWMLEKILAECFYKSEPYSSLNLLKSDLRNGRDSYYLKYGFLIFVIDKADLVMTTVLIAQPYDHLNDVKYGEAKRMFKRLKTENAKAQT